MITLWGVIMKARRALKLVYVYTTDRYLDRYPRRLKVLWVLMALGIRTDRMARVAHALYIEAHSQGVNRL